MHILESTNDILMEVAKACDHCLKPWRHSIIDNSAPSLSDSSDELIDLTLKVECRGENGQRYPRNDLELEIYKSGSDLSITIAWPFYPNRPILWHGRHSIWMDPINGKRSSTPVEGSSLEALARRLRSIFLIEE